MPVVKIVLTDDIYERLADSAEKNFRDPRAEAAWRLTRELESRGRQAAERQPEPAQTEAANGSA